MNWGERITEKLSLIRTKKPLIHNITNFVVMNSTANTILSVGASPVMSHSIDEVEEMVQFAGALLLNIGTLTREWVEAMIAAGSTANAKGIPVILDPVGAGATRLRTEASRSILERVDCAVVRGNGAEVLSLAGESSNIRGVDSLQDAEEAEEAAKKLARELSTVLAITGKTDVVTDGNRLFKIRNGHKMMTCVTGTGCASTAVIGCFLAVEPDALYASVEGLAYFGMAGERAAEISEGPGTFQVSLYDVLYSIETERILSLIKVAGK